MSLSERRAGIVYNRARACVFDVLGGMTTITIVGHLRSFMPANDSCCA